MLVADLPLARYDQVHSAAFSLLGTAPSDHNVDCNGCTIYKNRLSYSLGEYEDLGCTFMIIHTYNYNLLYT